MEHDIYPDFDLGFVDKAKEIGRKLIGLCSYYPPEADQERGATAMLDQALDEKPELPHLRDL